jgi:hypothetical protein
MNPEQPTRPTATVGEKSRAMVDAYEQRTGKAHRPIAKQFAQQPRHQASGRFRPVRRGQ